jgi:hypothetical protein
MSLTYDSFYYPFGKGSAILSVEPKIKELKIKYFDKISKNIFVSCIYNKSKDSYTFFFKIPSENDEYLTSILYDVVLEFVPHDKKVNINESSLKNYDINIFSNSPGFTFTFDFVITHKYHAMATCIPNNYISSIAVQKAPEIRNTYQLMTIEKTTWWAFFHLDYNGYLNKETIKTLLSNDSINTFIRKIKSQPEKLKEINEQKSILKEQKLKEMSDKNKKEAEKKYKKIDSPANYDPLVYDFKVSFQKPKSNILKNSMKTNKLKSKI